MASEVIGILRALLTADTTSYEAGMRKAAQSAKTTEKAIADIGKETVKLTPQAERMVKAFSGDKLIYQARNMAAAIEKIGGASKLTSAELQRAGDVAARAAEKMRALGVDVPKNIDALAKSATKGSGSIGLLSTGVAAFGTALAATFTVGAVVGAIRQTGEWAGRIDDLSKKLGISRESVQRLSFAAEQNGSSIDQVSTAISQLSKRLVEGDSGAVKALDRLNISFDDLRALSPDQAFVRVAKAIADLPDKFEQQATAMELLGRAGADLIPMFGSLESDMQKAVVASDALIESGDKLGDAWSSLKAAGMGLIAGVIAPAAPAFDLAAKAANRFAQSQLDAAEAQRRFREEFEKTGRVPDLNTIRDQIEQERMIGRAERGVGGMHLPGQLPRQAMLPEDAERAMATLERHLKEIRKQTEVIRPEFDAIASALRQSTDAAGQFLGTMGMFQGKLDTILPSKNLPVGTAEMFALPKAFTDAETAAKDLTVTVSALAESINQDFASMSLSISDAFADMLVRARSFKDGFLNVWRAIQQGISNILGDILNEFVGGFLRKMLNLGGGGFGSSGGIMNVASGAAGGLLGGFGGGAAAMTVDTLPGATAAGGGGVAGGFLTNPAFWTNPYTIAAAGAGALLTWAITKKGLFRGGEEGTQVNPRRDQFIGQFGPPGTDRNSGFGRLAGQLARFGSSDLFRNLASADSVREFEMAESNIIGAFLAHGIRGVKKFNLGGFVPPGMVQPAILHGGPFGEDIVPRSSSRPNPQAMRNEVHFHIKAIDSRGVSEFVQSPSFLRSLSFIFEHNKGFIASRIAEVTP